MFGPFMQQKPKIRRERRYLVSPKMLGELLEGGTRTREVRYGMPLGARITRVRHVADQDVYEVLAEHSEFPEVPAGQEPAEVRIEVLPAKPPKLEPEPQKWTPGYKLI